MNRVGIMLTGMLLLFTATQAVSDAGFPRSVLEELQSEGELVRYFYGDLDLEYLPFGPLSEELIADLQDQQATIGVEALFTIDLPAELAEDPGRDLILYNLMNRVSTLEGIEYYSASRERMRTLFAEAYRVDEVGSKEALDDVSFTQIPPFQEQILFQEDLTFGKNYVTTSFTYREGRFMMQVRNETTMWYYVLPLVKSERFRMNMLIIPDGKTLYFYGASSVDSASLFGIEKSKKDSFYNRIKAMYSWFADTIEKEYS